MHLFLSGIANSVDPDQTAPPQFASLPETLVYEILEIFRLWKHVTVKPVLRKHLGKIKTGSLRQTLA